jgi:hypothetical protein
MNRKSARIAKMMEQFGDEKLEPRYPGYFDCFKRGLFYEAHEVLAHH